MLLINGNPLREKLFIHDLRCTNIDRKVILTTVRTTIRTTVNTSNFIKGVLFIIKNGSILFMDLLHMDFSKNLMNY